MITRIVRMSFDPAQVDQFLRVFDSIKTKIRSADGCLYLSLHQDLNEHNVYYTISHWEHPENLEKYRESELFSTTWAEVKQLFNQKPIAYSLQGRIEL